MRVQLKVSVRRAETLWTGRVSFGDIVWVDEKAARHLLEHGICQFIGGEEAPAKIDTVPAEVAPVTVPKSVGGLMGGHWIALPLSKGRGSVPLSSASAAGLVLPQRV